MARGGRGFHANRFEILRACLSGKYPGSRLTGYLRDRLFGLPSSGWSAYAFTRRDWDIADVLAGSRSASVEEALLALATAYVQTNAASVEKLYAMGDSISGRLLSNDAVELPPGTDLFSTSEANSLFAFRVACGGNLTSPQAMKEHLEKTLVRGGWCHTRLMYPMINLVSHGRSADDLDDFLAYFASGQEFPTEKLALKLLLSDTAARDASLAFKLFVGLMGHPFDLCEILLDHVEYMIVAGAPVPAHVGATLGRLAELVASTRLKRLRNAAEALKECQNDGPSVADVEKALSPYGVGRIEAELLSRFVGLAPMAHDPVSDTIRPLTILANMRVTEYPDPNQFRTLASTKAVWSFVDGGRLIGALMRSLYMVDRTAYEVEARDVLRLASFFGKLNPMLVSAPSAMSLLQRQSALAATDKCSRIEHAAESQISAHSPLGQRLWINELQWRLRRLEDEGRVQAWLKLVRSDAKVKPLYLTGINWPWVEQIIAQQRLKPFRSFDGAYLLLLMEMEGNVDPLRLKLVLDGLLSGLDFDAVVATILKEYGDKAPAFLRRYLTTANLLSTGLATNHFSALDLRLKAIEEGVRQLGFSPLLTKEMWASETRLLTTELLLLNVNAGKFEVPWDAFRKDVIERHSELYEAFSDISGVSEESLSALVETPKIFKSGRKEQYKYRRSNAVLFQLIVQIIEDFLDHPAFGLEIILSGRFRHNIVLQELQASLAALEAIEIPPVTNDNKRRLIAQYYPALERTIFAWCTRRMHTRREEKPDALFDLVPTPPEMTELLVAAAPINSFEELVQMVIEWLKETLKGQVAAATQVFAHDLTDALTAAFNAVRDKQLQQVTSVYRPDDARRIHDAVLGAVLRRIEELEVWFGGVDSTGAGQVTLVQLGHATERLFENVMPGKRLTSQFDLESYNVSFEPHEAKLAFDLVRELAFNALKHGPGGEVQLLVSSETGDPPKFEFSNAVDPNLDEADGLVQGHRYGSPDEALTRDKNSGRLKIAASAATLTGCDVELSWVRKNGHYRVVVPLRRVRQEKAA